MKRSPRAHIGPGDQGTAHVVLHQGQRVGLIQCVSTFAGSFDGTTLNLESERVSLFVAGRSLLRQFRITGALKPGSANTLVGKYRGTLWGVFEIARPAASGTAPDSGSVIQTTADRAIAKQGATAVGSVNMTVIGPVFLPLVMQ